jgi:hypothetical protein
MQQEAVNGVKYAAGEKHQMQVKCHVRNQGVLQQHGPQIIFLHPVVVQYETN